MDPCQWTLTPLMLTASTRCLRTWASGTRRPVCAHDRWEEGTLFGMGPNSATHQTMTNLYVTKSDPQDVPHTVRSNHHLE